MHQLTPEQNAERIRQEAIDLVAHAERYGICLRIDRVPLQPLAMGHAQHVVETWPARHGPKD